MSGVLLDTHSIVWYLLRSSRLSQAAMMAIDGAIGSNESLYVSSISLVEIIYLVEKDKVPSIALDRLIGVLGDPEGGIVVVPFDMEVALKTRQTSRDAIPDMPDRIIAATALHLGLPLVTCDRRIREAGIECIW